MTAPAEGIFRLHLENGPENFSQMAEAFQRFEKVLRIKVLSEVKNSGAEDLQVFVKNDVQKANVEANEMLLEAILTATVTGRPSKTR